MKKFAVIDVGSNSVRLMLVADGKVLYKQVNTTRLGEGLTLAPKLLPAPIERTATAVADFYAQARKEGAETVYAFATAAVRAAENRRDFLDRVQALCGLQVEVIAGEEEAELGILGALGNSDGGVIDIGGASTEIVVKKGGRVLYKKSVDIGVVRLKDACGRDIPSLKARSREEAEAFADLPTEGKFYGIGGTATTIASQILGLTEYDPALVTGAKITRQALAVFTERLAGMTVEEIALLPCMPKGRADVILGGAVLLQTLMETLGIDEITASDRDNLEGYAVRRKMRIE